MNAEGIRIELFLDGKFMARVTQYLILTLQCQSRLPRDYLAFLVMHPLRQMILRMLMCDCEDSRFDRKQGYQSPPTVSDGEQIFFLQSIKILPSAFVGR